MMKLAMSAAAAALLRALLNRAGVERDRILLSDFRSVDWQSLTFSGERHEIALRIPGPGAAEVGRRIADGLAEHEFALPGHVVADIAIVGEPRENGDGSLVLKIEALTLAD
jgi:hypothetical protein